MNTKTQYRVVVCVLGPLMYGAVAAWAGATVAAKAGTAVGPQVATPIVMIRRLSSGQYRLYSRKLDRRTGRRRNLGTFKTRAAAERHERAVQFFKRRG